MNAIAYPLVPLTTQEVALHEAAHAFGHLKLSARPQHAIKEIRVYSMKLEGYLCQLPDWSLAPDTLRGAVTFAIGPAFEIIRGRGSKYAKSDLLNVHNGLRCYLRDMGMDYHETEAPARALADKMIMRLIPILERHMPTIQRIAERIMLDRDKRGVVSKSKCARLYQLLH